MNITFQTSKLEKIFNAETALQKTYGPRMAKVIKSRMEFLATAQNLERVPTTPPQRRHQLTGDRDEQFTVDLVHPQRLIFKPDHDPVPRKLDGGIDLQQVTAIKILNVDDPH